MLNEINAAHLLLWVYTRTALPHLKLHFTGSPSSWTRSHIYFNMAIRYAHFGLHLHTSMLC